MIIRQPPPTAHWRDSARQLMFFFVDVKAAFPFVFFLMHMKIWTFFVAFFAMIFFVVLNYFGFSVPVFLRWLRALFAGRRKAAQLWWM